MKEPCKQYLPGQLLGHSVELVGGLVVEDERGRNDHGRELWD